MVSSSTGQEMVEFLQPTFRSEGIGVSVHINTQVYKTCILRLSISLTCCRPLKPRSINTMSAIFLSSYCCLTNTDVGHLLCVVSTSQILGTIPEKEKCFLLAFSFHLPVQARSFMSSNLFVSIYNNVT